MMDERWVRAASEWDAETLTNYVPLAEAHIDELQQKLAFVRERLASLPTTRATHHRHSSGDLCSDACWNAGP